MGNLLLTAGLTYCRAFYLLAGAQAGSFHSKISRPKKNVFLHPMACLIRYQDD